MALGLGAGERVSLISEGKNNWVLGELGVLHAGAVCVPLSVKLETVQDITFRVNHSDSVMVLASDQQITKLRPMKELFPTVKRFILLDPVDEVADDEIYFDKVLELGDALLTAERKQVEERIAAVEPDSLANISYTSGTTANPKGIMLSRQLCLQCRAGGGPPRRHSPPLPYAADSAVGSLLRSYRRHLCLHEMWCRHRLRGSWQERHGDPSQRAQKHEGDQSPPADECAGTGHQLPEE